MNSSKEKMNVTDIEKTQIVLAMGNSSKGEDIKIIMDTKEITEPVDIFNSVILGVKIKNED